MSKAPLSQKRLLTRIDKETELLPLIHNWNVTMSGVTGFIEGSPHYVDGASFSGSVIELKGRMIRTTSGRRYELKSACREISEQMIMEMVDSPMELVAIRVKRNA
jgi:hypothetical protein